MAHGVIASTNPHARIAHQPQSDEPGADREPDTGRRQAKGNEAAAPDHDAERDAWAILASVDGLGPIGFGALLRQFGSATAALAAVGTGSGRQALAELDASEHHGRLRLAELGPRMLEAAAGGAAFIRRIRELDLSTVTLDDAVYPARLRTIEFPPHVLFVRGDVGALSASRAVAVVGTRRPSDAGRAHAARISAALARLGVAVVSGLAVGIDGAAHAATIDAGGPTVAVLAGGHARLYPRVHDRLADRIVSSGGAVIAELPPDTAPVKGTFPRRNRLISGLAEATVVVEAGLRSGALITAGWALEQGRDCFIVPGPIDLPSSAGALAFLRSFPGVARIVAGIPELLEDLDLSRDAPRRGRGDGPAEERRQRARGDRDCRGIRSGDGDEGQIRHRTEHAPDLSPGPRLITARHVLAEVGDVERAIGLRLSFGPCTVDEIVAAEGLPVAAVLGGLTLLEMRGLARGSYGRYLADGPLLAALPDPPTDERPRRARRAADAGPHAAGGVKGHDTP